MQVLLIYNHLNLNPQVILQILIRMFTGGPNHAAKLKDGIVHEMIGSSLIWTVKKLLGYKVSYEPNQGSGYKTTPFEEWKLKGRRIVLVLEPTVPLRETPVKEGYAYLALPLSLIHIILTKWLLLDTTNWKIYKYLNLAGKLCSEYIASELGRDDAYLISPADLLSIPELRLVGKFTT